MPRTRALCFAFLLAIGCAGELPDDHADHSPDVVELKQGLHQRFERDEDFRQVGLLVDAPTDRFEYRTPGTDWKPVDMTWSEGIHHVGRVVLDAPATTIEIRADRPWSHANVQFYDDVHAPSVLARDLPVAEPELPQVNGLAPDDLVISRAEWGARNPTKVCGSPHTPYRMAIHHTASPSTDGGDAAARMRQMQAYHIDSNGWCDIGYHFVVSQAGDIYQGRSTEERTGAHVGGHNSGNIGISLIGNFQEQNVSATQFNATAEIVGWVGRTYGIDFDRQSIKGHREHSGQGTSCPGDNLLARLDELIQTANDGPTPPGGHDARFEVRWLDAPTDFYKAGSSSEIPDLLPGETIRAEIRLKNTTPGPLRDVYLDYWFETPHLSATDYVIESDAPEFDGTSWGVNDADANPANPAKDQLGPRGTLDLYAMASGETKRILVDLRAEEYSLGLADHPDVRGWLRHAEGQYEEQADFNMEPDNVNAFEGLMQGFAQVDVLSPMEWQFDAGEPEQLEGWTGCAGVDPVVDVQTGALTADLDAWDCLDSPAWTDIDADTFDQLVLRMTVPASTRAVVYWGAEGETWSEDRGVGFDVTPDQTTYVIPLGETKSWEGTVQRLRITPMIDASGEVGIDAIFVQSSDGTVGSAREDYESATPVVLDEDDVPDPMETAPEADPQPRPENPVVEPALRENPEDIRVNEGCSTAGRSTSPFALLFILLVLVRSRDSF